MKASETRFDSLGSKRAWVTPAAFPVGTIGEVLRGGGGKLSPSPKDPGEERKVPAQDEGL
jgi:hypothetical protein